ncbi:hypothetical protein BW691_09465, partial [Escherichia coli]
SAQIREILINESAWEEMTCLFAPSLARFLLARFIALARALGQPASPYWSIQPRGFGTYR